MGVARRTKNFQFFATGRFFVWRKSERFSMAEVGRFALVPSKLFAMRPPRERKIFNFPLVRTHIYEINQ